MVDRTESSFSVISRYDIHDGWNEAVAQGIGVSVVYRSDCRARAGRISLGFVHYARYLSLYSVVAPMATSILIYLNQGNLVVPSSSRYIITSLMVKPTVLFLVPPDLFSSLLFSSLLRSAPFYFFLLRLLNYLCLPPIREIVNSGYLMGILDT